MKQEQKLPKKMELNFPIKKPNAKMYAFMEEKPFSILVKNFEIQQLTQIM